jgi:polyvinyl alcohol dehydrogenase (cytochrome)
VALTPAWSAKAKGPITVQPTLDHGVLYWGSWDGYEHATIATSGAQLWQTYLGQTTAPQCTPSHAGVASTAAVGTVPLAGHQTTLVFVGGGDAQLYALDARTGAIVWKLSLGVRNEDFLWSTPLFANGSVYMGDASFGDCPLTQGKVVKVDGATGQIEATFRSVPNGCIGGGIWTGLTLEPDDDALYFATGTLSPCSAYSESLVKVRASDLTPISSWQIPPAQRVSDGDFGAAPTLFQSTINGRTHELVGVVNKNGLFYAFDRDYLSSGPVWTVRIAKGGICPQCGNGSISGAAWDGMRLYVAGGKTTIDGEACAGSLRALDPRMGAFTWQQCFAEGPVLGAVVEHAGMVAVAEGNRVVVVDAATGAIRYSCDAGAKTTLWSPPAFVEDWIYQGSVTGTLVALKYEA